MLVLPDCSTAAPPRVRAGAPRPSAGAPRPSAGAPSRGSCDQGGQLPSDRYTCHRAQTAGPMPLPVTGAPLALATLAGSGPGLAMVWPVAGYMGSAARRFMPRMLRDSNACGARQAASGCGHNELYGGAAGGVRGARTAASHSTTQPLATQAGRRVNGLYGRGGAYRTFKNGSTMLHTAAAI